MKPLNAPVQLPNLISIIKAATGNNFRARADFPFDPSVAQVGITANDDPNTKRLWVWFSVHEADGVRAEWGAVSRTGNGYILASRPLSEVLADLQRDLGEPKANTQTNVRTGLLHVGTQVHYTWKVPLS